MEYQTLVGDYKASNGNDYYEFAVNMDTGNIVRIKNASCTATAEKMAVDFFGTKNVRILFNSINSEPNLTMIPKKYHKFFKEN